MEDAINSPVDLPSQISRYEDVLKYARSKVNFVFGTGLYMAPSNMELEIGVNIKGYNNKIVIATSEQALGLNNDVNLKPVPPKIVHKVIGTLTSSKRQIVKLPPADKSLPVYRPHVNHINDINDTKLTHEEKKVALIFGLAITGIVLFIFYE